MGKGSFSGEFRGGGSMQGVFKACKGMVEGLGSYSKDKAYAGLPLGNSSPVIPPETMFFPAARVHSAL